MYNYGLRHTILNLQVTGICEPHPFDQLSARHAHKKQGDMLDITEFVVGERYTNDQISIALRVENLGGVRPSVDERRNLRHIAIMTKSELSATSVSDNPYNDRIESGILIYTAQGKTGDQSISGRNKRILEQYSAPVPLYCFANQGKQTYVFLGMLELLRHYQEFQVDSTSKLRKAWVFEFCIHAEIPIIPISKAQDLMAIMLSESRSNQANASEEREVIIAVTSQEQAEVQTYEVEEIRSQLIQINPYRFEHLVHDVIEAYGFRDVTVTPPSQDGGIDVNAYVDEADYFFSNTHVQIQVKRWRHSVGSVEINSFRGALNTTAKGVFITTSHFTKAAIQEAQHPIKPTISLIDGVKFSQLVREKAISLTKYK